MGELQAGPLILRGTAVIGLVLANAFFVAAEFALVASRRTRIETLAASGSRGARAAQRAIGQIDRYISGTQLGITLASLSLGWIGEPAVAVVLEPALGILPFAIDDLALHAISVSVAFALITFLHIVLGELAPKALALQHPEAISCWVARPLIVFTELVRPFIWLLNGAALGLLRVIGAKPMSEAERVHMPEELLMLARQTQASGQLATADVRMIEGVFEFTEKRARDLMVPRTEIAGISSETTVADAAGIAAKEGFSRYPVYRESLDDIVGFIHIKQILTEMVSHPKRRVADLMRDVPLVPASAEVEDVLAEMKHKKKHLAVVLDEYGGTAGIVTMEDLLEEIVGPIYDETDISDPLPRDSQEGMLLPGNMEIDEANERFGLGIVDEEYATVGGHLFGRLGRLPRIGDRIALERGALEVVEMAGRRISSIRFVTGT